MGKHTELPWQVTPDKIRIQTLEDAKDYQIADCEDTHFAPDHEECKANAEFIVRACNSYYDLLEACKALIRVVKPEGFTAETITKAKKAIAKAEGK